MLPSRECESTGVSAGGGPPLRDLKVTDIFPNAGDGTGFGVDAVSNLEDEFTEKYSAPSDAPTFPISVQSAVVKGPLDFACDGLAGSVDPHIMQGGYAARAVIAPGVYYFGIVDILQTWSVGKIAEKLDLL